MSPVRSLPGVVLALGLAAMPFAQDATETTGVPEASHATSMVAVADKIRVTLRPEMRDDLRLRLRIENLGVRDVEFVPVKIRGVAETRTEGHVKRVRLKTYEANQYRRILARRHHTTGSLVASDISAGKRESQQPRRSAKQAQREREDRLRGKREPLPVKSSDSSLSGRVTPSFAPGSGRDVGVMDPDLPGNLLERRTFHALDWVEGSVYLKYKPADVYHVVVPVGETEFEFSFALPEPGDTGPPPG